MASSDHEAEMLNDDILLDESGDLKSGQQSPRPPARTERPVVNAVRLTRENFRMVQQCTKKVRALMTSRDKTKAFYDHNLRIYQQEIRPNWMTVNQPLPFLPGSTPFPKELHDVWKSTTAKFEGKLHIVYLSI